MTTLRIIVPQSILKITSNIVVGKTEGISIVATVTNTKILDKNRRGNDSIASEFGNTFKRKTKAVTGKTT